jgi:leader peptidase (prepilin peptidase)/N-methyltransferase
MYLTLAIIFVGWLAGMLVNYLADFLPRTRSIVRPYCLECNTPRNGLEYLLWPAPCRTCGRPRGWRAWIVAPLYAAAAIWLWKFPENGLNLWLSLALFIYFGVVVVVDLEHRLILHPVSLAGALIGALAGVKLHGVLPTLLGGVVGLGVMFLLFLGGGLFVRFLARWRDYSDVDEALGFGDVILSGVLGLILGWPGIVLGLIVAILLAGVVSLLYLLILLAARRYRANLTVAYGPFLVLGAIVLLFFRNTLLAPMGW